jgi:DNA primase
VIAQETIDAVRQRVSIVTVIGERLKLERRGQSHVGLCPFHKEKSPSFHVNGERGFFYCFGCKASGNVISFVQQLDGLTFPEAVRQIAERAGIEIVETGSAIERRQEAEERRRKEELYEANLAAAEFYERCLTQHPLASYAWAELGRRELSSSDPAMAAALSAFKVGYAPHGWEELAMHLRNAGVNRRAAEAVGLLVPRKTGDGYYDRFRHRLMFAVMDLSGKVIAFSGRSLDEPPGAERGSDAGAAAQKPAKYINSPESPIYRKRDTVFGLFQARQAIREQDRCVVVEGNFDVVSLHARGIGNVVAPLGTAFTADQANQITRYSRNATFVFDGDGAGQRAIAAAREPCQQAGITARAARLPDKTDPDDLIRREGREAVERLLKGAQPLLEYLIDATLRTGFSSDDAQARAAKIKEVAELITAETDPTIRSMAESHADTVAGRLGIADVRTFRALKAAVASAAQGRHPVAAKPGLAPEQARSPQRVEHIAHQVLGAVLEFPELLADPEVEGLLASAEGDLAMALMLLRELGPDLGRLEPAAYAARFPASIREHVIRRLAAPEMKELREARSVLIDNLLKLRRLQQRREQPAVVEELRRAQQSGDLDAQMNLLRLQQARARARHGLD